MTAVQRRDPVTVHFRQATAEDAATLHRLLHAMAAEVGRSPSVTEAALRAHGFGEVPRYRAVLAISDGGARGFSLFYPEFSSWRGQPGLYVQDLYVVPDARGAGIARGLLRAAVDAASDWGVSYVTLMVDHANDAGRAWYASQGFALRERGDLLILTGPTLDAFRKGPP